MTLLKFQKLHPRFLFGAWFLAGGAWGLGTIVTLILLAARSNSETDVAWLLVSAGILLSIGTGFLTMMKRRMAFPLGLLMLAVQIPAFTLSHCKYWFATPAELFFALTQTRGTLGMNFVWHAGAHLEFSLGDLQEHSLIGFNLLSALLLYQFWKRRNQLFELASPSEESR